MMDQLLPGVDYHPPDHLLCRTAAVEQLDRYTSHAEIAPPRTGSWVLNHPSVLYGLWAGRQYQHANSSTWVALLPITTALVTL
jgi:hypothetical protein